MYNVFPQTGEAGITVQYSGSLLNTATALDTNLLQPPTKHYMMFTSGDTPMVVGGTLTGATSAATSQIVAVVLTSGALTGAGAGIVFVRNIIGTYTAGETVTGKCVLNTSQIDCGDKGMIAKSIFLSVETNSLRINWTPGQAPTNSAATPASFGHLVLAGQNTEIIGYANAKNFQAINAVSATTGVLNVTVKF